MILKTYCVYCSKRLLKKEVLGSLSSKKIRKSNYATESANFEIQPFQLHKLTQGPSTTATLLKDDAVRYFKQMQTIRRMEAVASNLYKAKIIRGFCHLYSGEEAVAVGIKASMRDSDSVITAYRAHGWVYIMGVSPFEMLAELTGKQSGCARSKGGSMHMYTHNFYGGNGIVGAQVPLGTGIALAQKYTGTGGVCFTLYGDGAANQGQVFEAFNISKLWDLPCVYVCENNGYGMGTSTSRSSASTTYYTRGDYIPGIWVDGMDLLAVREAAKYAIDYTTSGKGPIILETATYRYFGHSMSDPGTSYRTRDEIQKVRETRDPITSFKQKIIDAKLASADELKAIENEVKKMVDEAGEKAKLDKEVGLDELATDVYAQDLEKSIRNVTPFSPLIHKRVGSAINLK